MTQSSTHLLDLSNQIVLITGGAGAIGRVVTRELASHGAHVIVNDIVEPAAAQELLNAAAVPLDHVTYHQADITDPAVVEQLLDEVTAQVGLPTTVCCHAGMVEAHPIDQYPIEVFDKLMNLNLRSAFLLARATSQRWIAAEQPGHLIFTASWVQDVPWPEITPYNTSKAGMKAMARGFARELAPRIRANVVAPGIVGVGMAKRQWDTEPEYRARASKAIPLGEMQTPESVAHAFLFLCSPMASYMTGSVLLVDGGCSLYPMD